MTPRFHKGLTMEKWGALSRDKRLLNIASELSRARSFTSQQDTVLKNQSIERALELIDMTVETEVTNSSRSFLKEFLRLREILASFYVFPKTEYLEFTTLLKNLLDLDARTHNLQLEI